MPNDTRCSVCGRPPHPIDDPECMPATKPIAEQLAWALQEIGMLRDSNVMLTKMMAGDNVQSTEHDARPGRDIRLSGLLCGRDERA